MNEPLPKLLPKDFATDQEVRWCPGCGDYAILRGVQKALADIGARPETTVFISGIGCSSRFPYYMATYGFHTIHGRAPSFATGIKLVNPKLDVWIVTGDGDGLSIGGNHLLHVLRRNVDVQILLFNNEIYGLTKGQYSPTSKIGTRSPSTPMGSVDAPLSPCSFALGAGARFIARSIDTAQKQLPDLLARAHAHKGASFVEIYQNCIVYNDGVFEAFTDKALAADSQIWVEHGKPMLYGKDGKKGLRLKPGTLELEVVAVGENGVSPSDILVHDETNKTLAHLLINLERPKFPAVLGVIYCNPAAEYEEAVEAQMEAARTAKSGASLEKVLKSGRTWVVE
ncbi:MAG: 2-oxoacid:ferredoxin oxidoreductase subunit beta [Sphingomonadales bacterium]|nr:2-oxoacid:ferredoxin oxidoreductase subunit beta [Sphingomonadales bacterium]